MPLPLHPLADQLNGVGTSRGLVLRKVHKGKKKARPKPRTQPYR